ncbi:MULTISPECIES: VOC family protein [Streptomycetaceae]|uniref:Putative hydroxylase n=1 Tax=Streptantibioticus cattleyicolor (strain ATCC 35852 / DSM 46488 / JCM 4925 / NBRC 14057 / NRRL 8057) TaxID=1003195 RepID=F8JZ46_STREN|nr:MULTISPECIES: VOC family protein [Streptomycetaceae]AEW94713.1 putative hydroxylase [Streptantibioticus cattleyicolor NRRL 8057 = DSM 46488]MYS59343.1 VOC family protein [Streptomyces sp. SID5468]CCB75068.1 putative hydroxylase [Streptantibioticus cattleyicolor NRRL 8057 = DSM 46488]
MGTYADGAPCWVDVMLPDLEAGKHFYGELLGWTFEDTGPDFGHYTNALRDGERVAGLMPKHDAAMPTVWTVYLASSDAAATAARIREAGGQVFVEPMAVRDLGTMLVAADPGGAVFGVWQGGAHQGFGAKGEPGSFCWTELRTRDSDRVDPFYQALFGYRTKQIGQAGGDFDYQVWAVGDSEGDVVAGRHQMGADVPADVPAHFAVYLAVPDCDEAVATVRRLGGTVHFGPHDSPFGRLAGVSDDQGASFTLIDPSTTVGERPL